MTKLQLSKIDEGKNEIYKEQILSWKNPGHWNHESYYKKYYCYIEPNGIA